MIVATALQAGAQGTGCYFQLGFDNLAKQIPDAVGKCTANERFNPANGNAEQPTDRGLLVWRKADNWTAYTDGYRTWLAGPNGLQDRLNDGPRFDWEQDIVDINANSNTNDLANTNTVTADGGNATGGTANAQRGASTNTNTNTVNPVINVVVNVPPSAATPTVVPTPALAITPTVVPTLGSTALPGPTPAGAPASTGQWVAWGRRGSEIGAFNQPYRLAVTSNGIVFVIDDNKPDYGGRIQKFDPTDSCQCWWVSAGALSRSRKEYTLITDIVVSSSDQLYIRKSNDQFITIENYTLDLTLRQDPFHVSLSSYRSSDGIATDNFGAIYAANETTILKIGTDGKAVATWGGPGSGPGQFKGISGIAIDSSGNVYVADTGNHRIQKLSPSGGRPIAQWGGKGSEPEQFVYPNNLALDAQGNIYVADSGNHRIQKLSPDGKFLQQWGNRGQFGNKPQEGMEPGQFKSPMGVAVDARGNLYVADPGNDRIQKLILNP